MVKLDLEMGVHTQQLPLSWLFLNFGSFNLAKDCTQFVCMPLTDIIATIFF